MTIAVDIDGVLTNLDRFRKTRGKSFFNKEVVNPFGRDVDEIFRVSKEDKDAFWRDNFLDYIKNYPFREDAKETIDELHRQGHRILIVTARKYNPRYECRDEEEFKELTIDTLKSREIYFDEIYFVSWPKDIDFVEEKIDVFIEDEGANVEKLSKFTKVIILDAPYNRYLNIPSTYRAFNLKEVVDIIKKMQ